MQETPYVPTEYLLEAHIHECACGTWKHEDADCQSSLWIPCSVCEGAPTDWVIDEALSAKFDLKKAQRERRR